MPLADRLIHFTLRYQPRESDETAEYCARSWIQWAKGHLAGGGSPAERHRKMELAFYEAKGVTATVLDMSRDADEDGKYWRAYLREWVTFYAMMPGGSTANYKLQQVFHAIRECRRLKAFESWE